MTQPPGFVDPNYPSHVCKLNKAIYGLKQAPQAWFTGLSTGLLQLGFVNSQADTSMFIWRTGKHLLVYVDDIIITGDNRENINYVISPFGKTVRRENFGSAELFSWYGSTTYG